jgi:hypothetical protein
MVLSITYAFFFDSTCSEVCLLLLYVCGLKVVESVNELAQIMKDLSVLVIDQVYETLIDCQYWFQMTSWDQTLDFLLQTGNHHRSDRLQHTECCSFS